MMTIFVPFQFRAQHRWRNAPEIYKHLRNYHEHTFKCAAEVEVVEEDREISFESLQDFLYENVVTKYEATQMDKSCETIANEIRELIFRHVGVIHMRGYKWCSYRLSNNPQIIGDVRGRSISIIVTEDGGCGARVN